MQWLKKHVPYSVVYLLIPPAACLGFVLRRPDLAPAIGSFGPVLTGYAALVVAVKAAQEWNHWLRQRQYEKRSEIAGRAIVSAAKFADALSGVATFAGLDGDPEQAEGESYNRHIEKLFDARLARAHDDLKAFEMSALDAEAYLPDAALARVRELWDLFIEVRKGWRKFAMFAQKQPGHLAEQGQTQVMDAEAQIQPRLAALQTELRKLTIGGNL